MKQQCPYYFLCFELNPSGFLTSLKNLKVLIFNCLKRQKTDKAQYKESSNIKPSPKTFREEQ
jgi:hypothetical protein